MKSTKSFGRTKFAPSGFNQPDTVVLPVDRKYAKPATVSQIYDLSHGKIYALISAGFIKSITLREPGRSRGSRLIEIASLEKYLQSLEEPQEVAP
jgi:hypothetical protein